jgi:2'-5' RNA ligase
MPGETHRLFFALWPDAATRTALAEGARWVRSRQHPSGRWTDLEKYHVTLQFLGGYPVWPEDIVARATAAAADVETEAFAMQFDRASSFGKRRGIVWWIGPSEIPPALHRLTLRLRDALRRHTVPCERTDRFTPHVTILRDAERVLAPTPLAPIGWAPADFVLAASTTAGYRVLARWPLRPAQSDLLIR